MDSRLKRQVIAAAVLMVVLVAAMVVAANYIQKRRSPGADEAAEAEDMQNAESGGSVTKAANEYGLDPDRDPYAFLKDDEFFDPLAPERSDPDITLSLLDRKSTRLNSSHDE